MLLTKTTSESPNKQQQHQQQQQQQQLLRCWFDMVVVAQIFERAYDKLLAKRSSDVCRVGGAEGKHHLLQSGEIGGSITVRKIQKSSLRTLYR